MKAVALPAYLIALLVVLFPISETILTVWPLQPGTTSWRFGAVGILSRALISPLLGVLIAFTTALLLEHRAFLRVLGVLNALAAVLILGVVSVFILDALQMRAQVRPELKTAFDIASAVALGKYLTAVVACGIFGFAAIRSTRQTPVTRSTQRAETLAHPAPSVKPAGVQPGAMQPAGVQPAPPIRNG